MHSRRLGRTGIKVSEIGFGAWGIGGLTAGATSYGPQNDKTSLAALNAAIDAGINFFDTSNCYGNGHSEKLIGMACKERRDDVVLATKAGRKDYETDAFSGPEIRSSLESSLLRLRTDFVDLFQLHGPTLVSLRHDPEIIEELQNLKNEGKIRAFGISVNAPEEGLVAIKEFNFPVVQINCNLVDQRARLCNLFELAANTDTGLIARTPLCFGFLSGQIKQDTDFEASDHRSAWSGAQVNRWIEASSLFTEKIVARDNQTPAQVAIRYCLSYPEISVTIPGILTPEEAKENALAGDLGPLKQTDMRTIEGIYGGANFFVRGT